MTTEKIKRKPMQIWEIDYDGDVSAAYEHELDGISERYNSGFVSSVGGGKPDNPGDIIQQIGWADHQNGVEPPDEFRCGFCGALLEGEQFRKRNCGVHAGEA